MENEMEKKVRRKRTAAKKSETTTKRSKPIATPMTAKQAQLLFSIDAKITSLYEKKDKLIKKIISTSGPSNELVLEVGGEKPFARVKVVDQIKTIEEGTMLFKSVGIGRFTSTISRLAKAPKGAITKEELQKAQ